MRTYHLVTKQEERVEIITFKGKIKELRKKLAEFKRSEILGVIKGGVPHYADFCIKWRPE